MVLRTCGSDRIRDLVVIDVDVSQDIRLLLDQQVVALCCMPISTAAIAWLHKDRWKQSKP